MFNVINILTLPWLCWGGGERGYDSSLVSLLGSQTHVQTINHKDASVEKKRNAKLKQSKVNENKPNDKPFFLFFQLCVCVCVCVLVTFFSPVQSSPVQPPPPQFPIGLNYCKKRKKKSFGVSNFKLINLLSNKLIYLFQNQPIIVVVVVVTFNVVFYCSYYI